MGKKQFDHIENRIREAAANSEPAFDESAWAKMEIRLSKEDNKKRRFLLWWFLLPLLFIVAGSTYFFLNNKTTETTKYQNADQRVTADKPVQQENIPSVTLPKNREGVAIKKNNVDIKNNTAPNQATKQLLNSNNEIATGIGIGNSEKISRVKKEKLFSKINPGEIADNNEVSVGIDSANFISDIDPADNSVNTIPGNNAVIILDDTIIKKDSLKNNITKNLPDSNKAGKTEKEIVSGFYFIASVAADIASVKFMSFQNSQLAPKFGIGIGYQFNKKISVQTGFYAGRKKYIAGPEDYNPKTGSYWDMVQIVKVDASCLVYDIPLTFRYNFLLKPTTVYYATAGFSSFVMKKEDYNYSYTYNNTPHESAWTYTGNKNFFSVFNISAGIEKRLSPNFSLLTEPSVSIPISGVGDGRVKLYSAALQVGIKYNPYRKHK
jgi:hypothetical protein